MLKDKLDKVDTVLNLFSSHNETKSHARHISKEQCKSVGLIIEDMESDNILQDLILTTHHAFIHTFNHTTAVKIVENQHGTAYIETIDAG